MGIFININYWQILILLTANGTSETVPMKDDRMTLKTSMHEMT